MKRKTMAIHPLAYLAGRIRKSLRRPYEPPTVRTLEDMSEAEKRDIEKRYGVTVKRSGK